LAFIAEYHEVFKSQTYRYGAKVYQYVCGLFQADKRNIEKMCETVKSGKMQNLQHFISQSPWAWEPVMERIAQDTYQLFLGHEGQIGLLIDESGWKKAGSHSVGVARQYLGNLGKVENGQVGVFVSLSQGDKVGIIDARLYLPEAWIADAERCLHAGIPPDAIQFKTKPELAVEMVRAARKHGVQYAWVGGDGLYGHDSKLRYALDDDGECYVLDVHEDEMVYLEEPHPSIPPKMSGKGRTPTRYQVDRSGIMVRELVQQLEDVAWQTVTFRKGTKGEKTRQVYATRVYTWNGLEAHARQERLIVSKQSDGTDLKYSLSNDREAHYSRADLLYMQRQRYWIEQSLKDAKSELGMAEYQVRTWRAWHHHIALTMLALLFMLQSKMAHHEDTPLLSCSDIRFILAHTLPQQVCSKRDIVHIIKERHLRRQRDMERFP
jgi:SRSO17 transposase